MLQRVPVALLDYHNRPHYVPAAWTITAADHFDQVIPELITPNSARLLYQDSILHDALECHTAATPRLVHLITEMARIAGQCLAAGQPITFPRRILPDPQDGHHLPEPNYDHSALFPPRLLFTGAGRKLSPAEAVELAHREGFSLPDTPSPPAAASEDQWLSRLKKSWHEWRDAPQAIAAQWETEKQLATASLERELRIARRQIQRLERQALRARLSRLGGKIRRLLRLPSTAPHDKAA